MEFLATLYLATLLALVAALPQSGPVDSSMVVRDEPSNFEVDSGPLPDFPPVQDGAEPVVDDDENAEFPDEPPSRRDLSKRATPTVQVWADANKGGRHEGLILKTQKCYNLGNRWPNQISSLSAPRGFGCYFYNHYKCRNGDFRLQVPGGNYIANLKIYKFNDKIQIICATIKSSAHYVEGKVMKCCLWGKRKQ